MKSYILDIIPKIQRFSKKLDNISNLANKHWIVLDELNNSKTVLIFREKNNQLLISTNGSIEKGAWDYLGNNSIMIDRNNESYLFKQGFIDEHVFALKVDGKEEYLLLVNEEKFDNIKLTVNTVSVFLMNKYFNRPIASNPSYSKQITFKVEKGQIEPNPKLKSVNHFHFSLDNFPPPQNGEICKLHEERFLFYSIKESQYYIKYFQSKYYPFYAALILDKKGMNLTVDTTLTLKKLSKEYFDTEDINVALFNIANPEYHQK